MKIYQSQGTGIVHLEKKICNYSLKDFGKDTEHRQAIRKLLLGILQSASMAGKLDGHTIMLFYLTPISGSSKIRGVTLRGNVMSLRESADLIKMAYDMQSIIRKSGITADLFITATNAALMARASDIVSSIVSSQETKKSITSMQNQSSQ